MWLLLLVSALRRACGRRSPPSHRPRRLPMNDPHDDELRWNAGRETDLGHDPAGLAHLGWIGLGVALDVDRRALALAGEPALLPDSSEVGLQLAIDPHPQPRVVRLERRP